MEKVSARTALSPLKSPRPLKTYSEVVEGMQFDRGYITPYMVTDTEKMEAVLDDRCYPDYRQEDFQHSGDLLPLLEQIVKTGKKLLIIAEDVEGEALATLVLNKLRGTFTCVAVKAPGFGDRRKEMLQDIAVLTGGEVITEELGLELKEATMDMLGRARQVKVDKENTVIVDGAGRSQTRSRLASTTSVMPDRDHHLRFRS